MSLNHAAETVADCATGARNARSAAFMPLQCGLRLGVQVRRSVRTPKRAEARAPFSRRIAASITALLLFPVAASVARADALVKFEAEAGALGADWAVSNSVSPAFITILTPGTGNNPSNAARVASFTVNFPEPGLYQLYARLRVGPAGFDDDSLFYASGFGAKSPTLNSDWVFVNGLAAVGFSNRADIVTGGGSLGSGMWKWINLSQFTSQSGFNVAAGNLTQTFQIGARENGLDLDQFAFGTAGVSLTVSNLDTGTVPPTVTLTNAFPGPDGMALHRFSPSSNGLNADGANPAAGLALFGDTLVGTTLNGGPQGAGTVFTMSLDGVSFTSVRAFTNAPDAGAPQGELGFAGNRFFSASVSGGVNGTGAVFAGQTNGSVTVLRSFAALNANTATNATGASPGPALALGGGVLHGTTAAGGNHANGTVFALTTNGATLTVLHHFSRLDAVTGTNADGAVPMGGLILSGGTLYGVASLGGAGGSGVVFSLGTNGANFSVLHHFTALDAWTGTNTDGALPLGGLVLGSNTLYGTTFAGGAGGRGTIFSLSTDGGGFTVLHHFTATDPVAGTNSDGASPSAALLLSGNVLYGTASAGGTGAAGTVFALHPASHQFIPLHSFSAVAANGTNAFGAFPVAPLRRVDGSLLGTAYGGGPGAAGTVFRLPVPPPPAVITNVGLNLNGTVTLHFVGGPHTTNVIQATPGLAPAVWQDVATNVADANGAWEFTDAHTAATRYYRSYAR